MRLQNFQLLAFHVRWCQLYCFKYNYHLKLQLQGTLRLCLHNMKTTDQWNQCVWGEVGSSKSNEMFSAAVDEITSWLKLGISTFISELQFSCSLREQVIFTNYLAIRHFKDSLSNGQIKKKNLQVTKGLSTFLLF